MRFKKEYILLSLLIIFHIINNLIFINLNKAPLPWDQANHTRISLLLKRCFMGEYYNQTNCLKVENYYPIFTHTITAFTFIIFGEGILIAQVIGTVFFVLHLIAIYLFFKEFFKDIENIESINLIGLTIYSLIPVIFNSGRYLWLEMPLLTNLYLCLLFLIKSKYFQNRKFSILSFMFAGFATMTKWYAPIYLFIPYLLAFILFFKSISYLPTRNKIYNLVLGVLSYFIIILPWYLTNYKSIFDKTVHFSKADPSQPSNLLSIKSLLWYLDSFVKIQFGPILAIIFFISLFYFFKKYKNNHNKKIIAIEILFVYIILSTLGNKDIRFTFFLLPIFTVIISYFISSLEKAIRQLLLSILFSWLLLNHFVFTTGKIFHNNYLLSIKVPIIEHINLVNFSNFPVEKPNNSYYPIKEIVDELNNLPNITGNELRILILFDYQRLNVTNLNLQMELNYPNSKSKIIAFENTDESKTIEYVKNFDYVLVSTYEVASGYYRYKNTMDIAQNYILSQNYTQIKSFKIPINNIKSFVETQAPKELISNRAKYCELNVCDEILLLKVK